MGWASTEHQYSNYCSPVQWYLSRQPAAGSETVVVWAMLFEPLQLGKLELENRIIHSATYECMATTDGEVTDPLVERYRQPSNEERILCDVWARIMRCRSQESATTSMSTPRTPSPSHQ